MKKQIAVIDKAPSRVKYDEYFDFEYELLHLSSKPLPSGKRLLKADIDLDFEPELYDLVILVGSEAAKHIGKISSVTNMAGQLVSDKFVAITNPAMLSFKPEGKADFIKSVDKLKKIVNGEINAITEGYFVGIEDPDVAMTHLLEILNEADTYVAIDTEGTALYPRKGYVLGISLTYKKNWGVYISTDIMSDEHFEILQKIVDRYEIVFHNMKYDLKMIEYHTPIRFNRDRVHDTMVMHYILDENSPHGLKYLALKYTDYGPYDDELEEYKKNYCTKHGLLLEEFTYDLIPFDIICKYASKDTGVTYELALKFLPIIYANEKLRKVYQEILLPGTIFLHEMEEVGIPIDTNRMSAAGVYLHADIEIAKKKLYDFPELHALEKDQGEIFNPNSVQQLRKLLFDYVGLTPTGKLTATGAISTDAEVLEELSQEHPLPAAILAIRQKTKLLSTYINKILPQIDRDRRIRTNFNLIFTTSGRLSSSGTFNAQQIPRDDPIIKGCIVAPPGYKIVSQDLKTGEMYYAAVLSGDENLQAVFKTGGDFHSSIAKMVFALDCDVDDVKKLYPEMRQSAKAIK